MQNLKSIPFQLDARFARYALLASAAIVAAKPAKASVVTTVESTPIDFTSGAHTLDVNGDGLIDFYFTGLSSAMGTSTFGYIPTVGQSSVIYGVAFDEFVVNEGGLQVAALGTGVSIGFSGGEPFEFEGAMAEFTATGILFAGLEFYDTNGMLHYGFAEFDPGQLLGYAYESTPYATITTFTLPAAVPEPDSLKMLALGAVGLEILRRKRARRS